MKKIIALILVLATIFSMNVLVLGTSAAEEAMNVTVSNEIDLASEEKTDAWFVENGYVALSSADDFEGKRAKLEETGKYYLSSDITLENTVDFVFKGELNGNGHTITIAEPLFDAINGATIENLKIAADIDITAPVSADRGDETMGIASGAFFGALANFAVDATITDVDVSGQITVGSSTAGTSVSYTSVGAIVGLTNGETTITGCDNSATVSLYSAAASGWSTAAGIVGLLQGDVEISNCTNTASAAITITQNSGGAYGFAGGMIGASGYLDGADYPVQLTVQNCVNNAQVTGYTVTGGFVARSNSSTYTFYFKNNVNNASINCSGHVGGIVGCNYTAYEITDCVNNGDMQGAGYTAGILAWNFDDETIVKKCTNNAESVISTGNIPGGIVGYSSKKIELEGCVNEADVSSSATKNAGGILGNSAYDGTLTTTLKDCKNTGDITGKHYGVAGILSRILAPVVIDGCVNSGTIRNNYENSNGSAGGIVAQATKALTISNCINSGEVIGYSRTGGIVGYTSISYYIYNTVNSGDVTGIAWSADAQKYGFVGGFVGAGGGAGTLINCVNSGNVLSNDTAGGLIGYNGNNSTVVKYCLVSGNVTTDEATSGKTVTAATRMGAGGIVGNSLSVTITVDHCIVSGNIVNTNGAAAGANGSGVGGFLAYVRVNGCSVTNSAFIGTVSTGTGANVAVNGTLIGNIAAVVEGVDKNGNEISVTTTGTVASATAEELASGKLVAPVCAAYEADTSIAEEYKTGLVWGQTINTDAKPTLGGAAVKKAEGAEVYYNDGFAGNLTLKDDLTLNAWANASVLDASELTVKFTMNGETTDAIAASVADKYYAKAAFTDIAPQYIGEEIEVALYLGETELTSDTISIVEYLEKIVELNSDKNTDIAKALLRYGYEARAYVIAKNIVAEADVAEIESDLLDTTALAAPNGVPAVVHEKNPDYDGTFCFYSANVFFNNVNSICLTVYIPEAKAATAKVVIDGEEVELVKVSDGVYEVSSADIYAKAFGDHITAILYDGETVVGTLKYSIDNYAERIAASTTASAEMKALALATYYYGAAAAAYAG